MKQESPEPTKSEKVSQGRRRCKTCGEVVREGECKCSLEKLQSEYIATDDDLPF